MTGNKPFQHSIVVGLTLLSAIAIPLRLSLSPVSSVAARESLPPTSSGVSVSQLGDDPLKPPDDNPSPTQTAGGGTRYYQPPQDEEVPFRNPGDTLIRGQCEMAGEAPAIPLTPLIPSNHVGLSQAGNSTTFFIYVPKILAPLAEFAIYDRDQTEQIYQTTFRLTGTEGIVSITVPAEDVSLATGEYYKWYFSIICNPEDRAADLFTSGWIKPTEPSPTLVQELENANGLDRARLYGENGFWYPTLEILAELQRSPNDLSAEATEAWQELLGSEVVKLEEIAEKPLIECCKTEN